MLSLATNVVSAAIGFVALWPVLFYEPGVSLALRMFDAVSGDMAFVTLMALIALIIVVLNVCIEYWVAIRWCGVPGTLTVLGNVAVANLLSFALVVFLVLTFFELF